MSEEQLAALAKSSQNKKQAALLKTEKAIAKLVDKKLKITIRSVAREAGVSVSYIYKYPELAYKIQTLREQQKYSLSKEKKNNLERVNALADLEQENLRMKQEIENLKLYINRNQKGGNSQIKMQQENIQLLRENEELKRVLEYTEQKLQSARRFILGQGQDNSAAKEAKVETGEAAIQKITKIRQI